MGVRWSCLSFTRGERRRGWGWDWAYLEPPLVTRRSLVQSGTIRNLDWILMAQTSILW